MSDSLLRRPDVEEMTGLSRAWIYAAMQRGDFPKNLYESAGGWSLGPGP